MGIPKKFNSEVVLSSHALSIKSLATTAGISLSFVENQGEVSSIEVDERYITEFILLITIN